MRMSLEGLTLTLIATRARSTAAYEDWVSIDVDVLVPAFRGNFEWSVMFSELKEVLSILTALESGVGSEQQLEFRPCEPNVSLEFRSSHTGQVTGKYSFVVDFVRGPELSGTFNFDQSYLPQLIYAWQEMLAQAAPN